MTNRNTKILIALGIFLAIGIIAALLAVAAALNNSNKPVANTNTTTKTNDTIIQEEKSDSEEAKDIDTNEEPKNKDIATKYTIVSKPYANTSGTVEGNYPVLTPETTVSTNFNKYVVDKIKIFDSEDALAAGYDYEIYYLDDENISILITGFINLGGASPTQTIIPINFSIKNNKVLTLTDISAKYEGVTFLQNLEELSKTELVAVFGEDSLFIEGLNPTLDNYDVFNFSNNQIKVTFEKYQIAPGAAGTPSVEFELDEVVGL